MAGKILFWSPEKVAIARRIVDDYYANGGSPKYVGRAYDEAARVLGVTKNSVRMILRTTPRGPSGRYATTPPNNLADGQELRGQSPPPDVLDKYTAKVKERAEDGRVKALEQETYALRQQVATFSQLTLSPLKPVARHELRSGLREACAFALLSDVHCEQIVHKHETPVGNEYNAKIADQAIGRFFSGFRWLTGFHRQAFKIRESVLWLGGDLMTGHIHDEKVETTGGQSAIETSLWLMPRLVAGIDLLLEDDELDRLLVPCSYGNHGRTTRKPYRARGAAHSYEWALYQALAGHYRNEPRVQFLADPSAHQYLTVYEFENHFHHGDETSYQGGVGGVMIPLNKAVAQWDIARRCHYHNFGHWHQYLDTGRIAVNGSAIGYDAYSMSIKATPEAPAQSFYLLDSKRGKCCKSPIWVRESTPADDAEAA